MADAPKPIIILAAPFSGASWLAGVLGQHPGLYALPQLFPFMAERVGELREIFALSQADHGDGLRRAVAQLLFQGQTEAQVAQADDWLDARPQWTLPQLLEELAAHAAPRRLVIPDAEAPLRPHELHRLRLWLPEAQWLHLVRHPWSQGCRLADWLQQRLFVPVDFRDYSQDPPPPEPQIPWLRANHNLESFFAAGCPPQHLRVTSEALDAQFPAAIAALCTALGLETNATVVAAMAEPQRWPFAAPGPQSARGGLEAEVWDAFTPEAERLAAAPRLDAPLPWRRDGAGFDAQVLELARRYGYR